MNPMNPSRFRPPSYESCESLVVQGSQQPAAALQALLGLTRARSKQQMQLALLQLHQAIAAQVAPPSAAPPSVAPPSALAFAAAPSPLLMSPSVLSALLTPSGSGFRVDFGAALSAMTGEVP